MGLRNLFLAMSVIVNYDWIANYHNSTQNLTFFNKNLSTIPFETNHQYSHGHELGQTLGDVRDREACCGAVHRVTKRITWQLNNWYRQYKPSIRVFIVLHNCLLSFFLPFVFNLDTLIGVYWHIFLHISAVFYVTIWMFLCACMCVWELSGDKASLIVLFLHGQDFLNTDCW